LCLSLCRYNGKKKIEKSRSNPICGVYSNCMSKSGKYRRSSVFVIVITAVCILAFILFHSGVREPWTSPANACINNLREIDAAKNKWMLEHNAKTNDVITLDDIKPYLVRYGDPNGFIKLDAGGNLPKCPAGGFYTIGKVGESPTCSLGATVTPHHILP
jgi:hypothetical protein